MAIPGSGPVSFSQIQTEHGGSNPISLSEYYGADTGVPGSGTISVSDFYGTSSSDVTMDTLLFTPTSVGPGNSSASATVSGINQTVTLSVSQFLLFGSTAVRINSGSATNVGGGININVSNGDVIHVDFTDSAQSGSSSQLNGSISFVNTSDGNASVGTLTSSTYGSF